MEMAKYAINHPKDFHNPKIALTVGVAGAGIAWMISMSCIIKICSVSSVIDTLSSYVSYTAISFMPNFVFLSLPQGHALKKATPDITIDNRRRNIEGHSIFFWCVRVIYKFFRIFFCSFWYYWAPLIPMSLPLLMANVPAHDSYINSIGQPTLSVNS